MARLSVNVEPVGGRAGFPSRGQRPDLQIASHPAFLRPLATALRNGAIRNDPNPLRGDECGITVARRNDRQMSLTAKVRRQPRPTRTTIAGSPLELWSRLIKSTRRELRLAR